VDEEAVDLRPAHQPAFHAEDQPAAARGPDEFVNSTTRRTGTTGRRPGRRPENPEGRWRAYDYEELAPATRPAWTSSGCATTRWPIRDNLPPPDVIAQEIVDDLEAALEQFRLIAGDLAGEAVDPA
jgi:type I restriction enzyme M protein